MSSERTSLNGSIVFLLGDPPYTYMSCVKGSYTLECPNLPLMPAAPSSLGRVHTPVSGGEREKIINTELMTVWLMHCTPKRSCWLFIQSGLFEKYKYLGYTLGCRRGRQIYQTRVQTEWQSCCPPHERCGHVQEVVGAPFQVQACYQTLPYYYLEWGTKIYDVWRTRNT